MNFLMGELPQILGSGLCLVVVCIGGFACLTKDSSAEDKKMGGTLILWFGTLGSLIFLEPLIGPAAFFIAAMLQALTWGFSLLTLCIKDAEGHGGMPCNSAEDITFSCIALVLLTTLLVSNIAAAIHIGVTTPLI